MDIYDHEDTLTDSLHNRFLSCGEILGFRDVAEYMGQYERDYNVRFDLSRLWDVYETAADRFVDSMVRNAHDTSPAPEDLYERITRWEAMRPRHLRIAEIQATLEKGWVT